MIRRSFFAVAAATFVLSTAVDARADKEGAAAHFREAKIAYEAGDHIKAAGEFERAYDAAPHGAALYNAGIAWALADRPARAAAAFERALLKKEDLSKTEAADATARLESLRNHLATLDVRAAPGDKIFVDSEPALEPKAYVVPGLHTIVARHPDGTESPPRKVDVRRGAAVPIDLTQAGPAEDTATGGGDADADKARLRKTAAYALFGLSGVAVVGTVIFGVKTLDAKDDLEASGRTDADARDSAITSKTLTNVSLLVAVAAAAGGGVLLFVLPRMEKKTGVYLSPTGAMLRGTF